MTTTLQGMDQQQMYDWVVSLLVEMFELDPAALTAESNLYADLDIDSIDAVDLAVRLKQQTGLRIQPDVFKNIRTIGDVVGALQALSAEETA